MIKPLLFALLLAGTAGAAAAQHPIEIGKPAPSFDLPVFGNNQKHMSLADLQGKVVLLDFWASWCGPCRQSFPLYEKLRTEMPRKDFVVLAINLDEMAEGPIAFLEEHPVGYVSLADPAGEVARQFGLIGMPSSYVIDRDGIVRARHTGFKPQDIDEIRKEVLGLLGTNAETNQDDNRNTTREKNDHAN